MVVWCGGGVVAQWCRAVVAPPPPPSVAHSCQQLNPPLPPPSLAPSFALPPPPPTHPHNSATGLSSLALLEAFPGARATGVDLSPHYLAVATVEQREREVCEGMEAWGGEGKMGSVGGKGSRRDS